MHRGAQGLREAPVGKQKQKSSKHNITSRLRPIDMHISHPFLYYDVVYTLYAL